MDLISSYLHILACPLCHSNLKRLGSELICASCKKNYPIKNNIPIFLTEDLGQDLKQTIQKWDQEYEDKINSLKINLNTDPYLQSSIRHIHKFISNKKGLTLELGCGSAKNSAILAREGREVVGIEISYRGCLAASKLFEREKLKGLFICGNILQMPFRDDVFPFMYAGGTIEHFQNTKQALRELHRVLAPSGFLTATTPYISLATPYWLLSGNIPEIPILKNILEYFHLKMMRGKYLMYGYEKSFTKYQIINLFKKAGFKKIQGGPFDTYMEIKFVKNEFMKNIFRRIAKSRFFTPMIYINGEK